MRRLNIARLIMLYVKKFEITDPAEALQYFFFLRYFFLTINSFPVFLKTISILSNYFRNLRDPEGRNLFLVCVTDLAIECRDYDLIFGKLQPSGIRSR